MKISYNWLKDYLNISIEPSEIAEILTGIGLEIEGVENWVSVKGGLEGVVIGEVLTSHKHPGADNLSVTTVDIGKGEPLHIVCGAPNVAAGQKVPVATIGTTVFKGDEIFEIKKAKIRGELSEGMICAEDEIGLGTSHTGIMVLDPDAKTGTPAAEYFKIVSDTIFEIGLTPNRIDSGSHFGVARDLAAWLNINGSFEGKAQLPSVDDFHPDNNENPYEVIIENTADCPRYTGITISGVNITESPEWLKIKLRSIGLNPINNVVDITNFVQNEVGQPLHSFDADMIDGRKVIIGNPDDKSKFVTLDGVERNLSSKDLMICNVNEGMCIAGVFGGIKSGVTGTTKNIFLESAYFNPVSIRKTSKRHALKTDASFRFERGADPDMAPWALKRAAMLIRDIAGGKISSGIVDIYPEKLPNAVISVTFSSMRRLMGKSINRTILKKILGLLDIKIKDESTDALLLEIPLYRVDVKNEADVVEEILRIYGYNNIEINEHVNSTFSYLEKPDPEKLVNTVSDMLTSNGFAEIMCNSLNPSAFYENGDFNREELVILSNPLSSDLNAMRQSLLYGGLSSVKWNINRQNPDLKLYEFGNCYFYRKSPKAVTEIDNYSEKMVLGLFITGRSVPESWNNTNGHTDFFRMKSYAGMVMTRMGLKPETLISGESDKKWFSESVTYKHNNHTVAEIGKISKPYLDKFDISQDVFHAHIEWDKLLSAVRDHKIFYQELPKYPAVRRDLALLLDKDITFGKIRDIAFLTEKNILQSVGLFDVYESESLGKNKKSYAVSFILQDNRKTLTDKSIEKVMSNLISAFEKEVKATIRK